MEERRTADESQQRRSEMKRLAFAALVAAALMPVASSAQSPEPAASPIAGMSAEPMASQAPIGVDTMDVCISITGPVTLLTAESLTQGIIDGTFVINGLSDACQPVVEASPGASMTVPLASVAAPMASPEASPAS
jgi:hypothetical protein